jgi:CBS domain-containing protein
MSPRAAWQLEAMGFADVYDFAEGKMDWIAHGLPTEGRGPYSALAGEVADRDAVLACRVGDRVGEVSHKLETVPHDYCVVLNDNDVILGRMRKKNIDGSGDAPVERVMEPGPTTVRPSEPAGGLLERMEKKRVPTVIISTNKGRLMGVVTQNALDKLVSEKSRQE